MLAANSLLRLWLLVSVWILATPAIATDHWEALPNRHACNGHCAARHQRHAAANRGEHLHRQELLTELGYASPDNSHLADSESVVNESVEQDDDSHLFLSIQSLQGDQAVSGLTRTVKLEYSPVVFEMHSTNPMMPSEFRLLIDGIAAHPEQSRQTSEWLQSEQSWSRTVEWSCPPLGRHSVQFQIRLNNRLIASEPLWIEIVAPAKPEAIAVGSSLLGTRPVRNGEVAAVYYDTMVVRFAMSPTSEMLMHVDGLEDIKASLVDDCSFEFNLKRLSVGRHAVRFSRVVGDDCAMNSERSETLWIQYEPLHALSSVRNENSERRKAIVDQIRSVAIQAKPTFPDAQFLSRVNSEFQEPRYEDQMQTSAIDATNQTIRSATPPSKTAVAPVTVFMSQAPEQLPPPLPEQDASGSQSNFPNQPATVPTLAPELPSPTAAPALNPEPVKNESKTNLVVPPPKQTRAERPFTNRFVALATKPANTQAAQAPVSAAVAAAVATASASMPAATLEQSPAKPVIKPMPNPLSSEAYRNSAQNTASILSMFEDNLASAESAFQISKDVSHVIFDAPAYFTQNGYGPSGQEDARKGLVLLEGMELSAQASGHWKLTIPYIKSETPAVLHLQIQFKTDEGEWKPITIQPICLKAGEPCIDNPDCLCESSVATNSVDSQHSVKSDCSDRLQPKIVIQGYSPILRREVGYFTEIRRRGSVVFGHGYSALEDRRGF